MQSITVVQALNSIPPLGRLQGQSMPIKVSMQVVSAMKSLTTVAELYEANRIRICQDCGTLNDENNYDIEESKREAFNEQQKEILEEELSLDIDQIDAVETGAQLAPVDVFHLAWLLK